MYQRYCLQKIEVALTDTPVVVIVGPRQSGKSTLAKQIGGSKYRYVTLDDATQYSAAKNDPVGYIRNLSESPIIIDEVQRVPELLYAIKQSVDEDRRPGRFILTGSTSTLLVPALADALTGRMEVVQLLPLATCEITGTASTFLNKLIQGQAPTTNNVRVQAELINKILAGGYPEPLMRSDLERRFAWYQQYLMSIAQKDLQEIGKIEHVEIMPKLMRLIATQVAQICNYTELAGKLELSRTTITSYLVLLEQLYLIYRLPAWHKNESKRLVKTPKMHIVDSGLLSALRYLSEQKIKNEFHKFGFLLENYVVNEIKRIATWQKEPLEFYYYRDKDQNEVDLIIETFDGKLIGIEVKAGASIIPSDLQGLRRFKELAKEQFHIGIILYDGDHTTFHDEGIFSVPFAALWE